MMAAGNEMLAKDADAADANEGKGRDRIALVLLDRDGVLNDVDAEGVSETVDVQLGAWSCRFS